VDTQTRRGNLECLTNLVTIEHPHLTRKGLPVGGAQALLPQDSVREVDTRFRAEPCSVVVEGESVLLSQVPVIGSTLGMFEGRNEA
jgi:hypothetical protein